MDYYNQAAEQSESKDHDLCQYSPDGNANTWKIGKDL